MCAEKEDYIFRLLLAILLIILVFRGMLAGMYLLSVNKLGKNLCRQPTFEY